MLPMIHLICSVCRWHSTHLLCWNGFMKHESLQRWVHCFDDVAFIWLAQMIALYVFNRRAFTCSMARAQLCSDHIGICYQTASSVQNRSIYFCCLAKSDATHLWNWWPSMRVHRERLFLSISFFFFIIIGLVQRCIFPETYYTLEFEGC